MECGRGPGIYAPVGYARVFVYLCGTQENLDDGKDREVVTFSLGREKRTEESQWPAKVCCPFGTRE